MQKPLGAGALGFYTQLVHGGGPAPAPPSTPPGGPALWPPHPHPFRIPPVSTTVGGSRWVKIPFSRISRRTGKRQEASTGFVPLARTGHALPGHGCSGLTAYRANTGPVSPVPTSPLPNSVPWTARRQIGIWRPHSSRIWGPATGCRTRTPLDPWNSGVPLGGAALSPTP